MSTYESILTSVKKMLSITEDYEYFDPEIIMHINSTFMILQQIGVGPVDGYMITDKTNTWDEFFSSSTKNLNMVKSYLYMRVKLLFDNASMSSGLIATYEKQIAEYEWRLRVQVDPGDDYSQHSNTDILQILYSNAVNNGYTGTYEQWVEKFNGNGGDASLKDDLTASIPAGGIKIGDKFYQGEELEALWRALLDPVKGPSFTNPSVVITTAGGLLMEPGEVKNIELIVGFNRGSISPAYGTSGFRVGEATLYNVNGIDQTDNRFQVTVDENNNSFTASVAYDQGEQPKNSKGEDYDQPHPAGQVTSSPLVFEFVNPIWSNASDITQIVKESLVSKISKSRVFDFAPQTKQHPEVFDVPADWNVTAIEVFNDITQRYEDNADEFTMSMITHQDAAGRDVNYKRYTDRRGYAAGERSIKITWN